MGPRDRWIMAAIIAVVAAYFFEWKALSLYAVAGAIYLFSRGKS